MATSQADSESTSVDNTPKRIFTRWDITELKNWLVFKGVNDNAAGIFEGIATNYTYPMQF